MKKTVTKRRTSSSKKSTEKPSFLSRHPFIVPIWTFMALFFIGMVGFVMLGGSTQGAADAHIVNIYADGEQRTVTTRAKTVGELIERLQLKLIPEDIVEPKKDAPILEDDTQVNVYRSRPVEIIDNGRTLTLLTAQRAPRLVAAEAGIDLIPEDEVSFEKPNLNVLDSGASEQLVVKRAVEVQLNVYGAIKLVKTTASSVDELLAKESITADDGDTVEPVVTTAITPGMLISINKPGIKTQVVTEEIAFAEQTKDDAELQAGKTRVDQEGVNGQRAVVYEITEENGVEVARREIQQVILKEPITRIVARGTKIISPSFSPTVTVAGDKASLMAAAGIAESDFSFVDYIVSRESGWKPGSINSYSGAYGLCQALPASKMSTAGSDYLSNPVTQLRWCSGYASGRYGSWAGAYQAWQVQGWW